MESINYINVNPEAQGEICESETVKFALCEIKLESKEVKNLRSSGNANHVIEIAQTKERNVNRKR